ncbi:MAG: ASCH domain-containing protein [Patescibacteria group bacterium]|jgi:ASC-1-like (ASCH) protein
MPDHKMSLQPKYFKKIASGEKSIECRLFDEKRKMIKAGDFIDFENVKSHDIFRVKVTELIYSKTFAELIDQVGVAAVGGSDKQNFLAELYEFYTPKQESSLGVVGIKIALL